MQNSKKTTSLIQVWTCILLILTTLIFSFTPLITLDTGEHRETIEVAINKLLAKAEVTNTAVSIPDEVSISAISLIETASLVKDISDLQKDESEQDPAKIAKLRVLLSSESGQKTLITVLAFANTVTLVSENMDLSTDSLMSQLLMLFMVLIAFVYVLLFTLLIPLIYLITAVLSLVTAIRKYNDPIAAAPKVSAELPAHLTLPLVFMLFQRIIPGMSYGIGVMGIWVTGLVCVLLNLVISRLRTYRKDELLYLNLLQGGALLGTIAYAVFFFNLLKADVFHTFLDGGWAGYAARATVLAARNRSIPNTYLVDAALVLLSLWLVLSSVSYFTACARRISCTGRKDRRRVISDTQIPRAAMTLLACILPLVVKGSKHLFEHPQTQSGAFSSLELSAEQISALTVALVAAAFVLAIEIALAITKHVLCKKLSKEAQKAILTGCITDTVEESAPTEEATEEEVATSEQ